MPSAYTSTTGGASTLIELPSLGHNRIINGDFTIDQRNAGASKTINSAAWTYCMDRWASYGQATDGVFTVQQVSSSVPTSGAKYVTKITITTADASIGSAQIYAFRQVIEGYHISDLLWGTAQAVPITLSFWVRSSVTGTFSGALRNTGNTRSYPFSFTISVADTWEYKTITMAGCTDGTWDSTNGLGLQVDFDLGCGSSLKGPANTWASTNYMGVTGANNLISTLNATMYLADVQLEVGGTATAFERRLLASELRLCMRYYQKIGFDTGSGVIRFTGYATGASQGLGQAISFLVPMRGIPVGAIAGTWGVVNCAQPGIWDIGHDAFSLYAASSAAGQMQYYTNDATDGIIADAEL